MGCCCPIFAARVGDNPQQYVLEPHTQGQDDSHCRKIEQNLPPVHQVEVPAVTVSNPTQHQVKSREQINQMQSNLQIALSASIQNQEERSQGAYQPRIQPKMVLFHHSQIRESVLYRWELPQFVPDELFLPIDLDRIFKKDDPPRQEERIQEVTVQN